jgi:tRNA threonylcarbamoyladenosine biosynthesis protein TsaB
MRVLAVDTATEACSVALLSGDQLIGRYEELGKSHAQQILSMVDAVLAEARMSLSMLDGIAASIGPGAFTGVRISVAVAQGLAFGAGLDVAPVTTLEALASQVIRGGASHALACLDARMGEVYWGCFAADPERGLVASSAARVGPPEGVVLPVPGAYRGIGRGFDAYPGLAALPGLELDPRDCRALPNAREIARLGALRLRAGQGLDPADLSPLYLRDKVALTEAERGVK